jgi:hypothetical protein
MHGSIPGISVRPSASRQLARYLILLHLATLALLMAAPQPASVRLALLAILALHAIHSYRHATGSGPGSVAEAHIEADGRTVLVLGNGRKARGVLRSDSLVTPWVMVLRFDTGGWTGRRNLPIFNDALSDEERRLLRVLLNFVRLDQ